MWIEEIKPYTKYITINYPTKTITLVHPHFKSGQLNFRRFLKSIKQNTYQGYTVDASGFARIKGFVILEYIKRYLSKLDNVKSVELSTYRLALYNLKVVFK